MIVLDTHAWIWWVGAPDRLSDTARRAIEDSASVGIASISCWEVGMLVLKGRIELDRPVERWVPEALAQPGVQVMELTPQAALAAALLEREGFAGDPVDRLLHATARDAGRRLVTADREIREFDPRGTLW